MLTIPLYLNHSICTVLYVFLLSLLHFSTSGQNLTLMSELFLGFTLKLSFSFLSAILAGRCVVDYPGLACPG
jgi:hypothetical protein